MPAPFFEGAGVVDKLILYVEERSDLTADRAEKAKDSNDSNRDRASKHLLPIHSFRLFRAVADTGSVLRSSHNYRLFQ